MSIAYTMNLSLGGYTYIFDSVYTVKEYRGQGVFKELFKKGVEIAKLDKNLVSLKLLVDKANEGAIKTYERLGYVHQADHLLYHSTINAF